MGSKCLTYRGSTRKQFETWRVDLLQHSNAAQEVRGSIVVATLLTLSVSLWFYTIGVVKIYQLPADAYYYLNQLPVAYWLGLIVTLALLGARGIVAGRARTLLDLTTLFLLSLYLFAVPSFGYQNPRFLDTYQHEGNALALLFSGGWYQNPVWYLYQFPGGYTFFAQLTAVAGIDPFQLMKFYPVGMSLVVALLLYSAARSLSRRYAATVSALIMSGLWFQLHLSPQSLELILYIGFLFLLIKTIDDKPNRVRWSLIGIAITPILVLSHPETPLVLSISLAAFFVLQAIFASNRLSALRSGFSAIGANLLVLTMVTLTWWTAIASGALSVVTSIVNGAIASGIAGLTRGPQTVPLSPAPSYHTTILLQEGISAFIWVIGLLLLVFIRRFRSREYLLAGLILAAIATIPVALFGNADVLQRSYLFSLFPTGLLLASLLERGSALRIKGQTLVPLFGKGLVLLVLVLSIAMPVSRYGLDSFDYLTQSSLATSNVAAGLSANHSILMLHPGWYGWRFYAPLDGYQGAVRLEQSNITANPNVGGFIKINTESEYNLTYTSADSTANYVLLSDFFQNLYILRFGSNATAYVNQKAVFEAHVSDGFNLVYSTGSDRLYENRNLG